MSTNHEQRVETLRFYLFDRPLHPELFEIYADQHIVKSGYEARIWVTGCTHVIAFYRDDASLVELIANSSAMLPQRGRLFEVPLRRERTHERMRIDGINYMMNFQVELMKAKVYSVTHNDLARMGSRRGLFVSFPARPGGSALAPFALIDYQAKPNGLHVFAFHAFPEDLTIIKTQSIFELS
ncbi:MAG: DUF2617 family protein [Planctomycetes bacterium]|nr:DUF2617 family protein [Planctomycetota bacterium]